MNYIPYGRQDIKPEDIESVNRVLRSDFITQGPELIRFEESLLKWTGAQYASVMNSATSALHVAYRALGVGKGDWVWTSPITFVATSNAALFCDAQVDFVDVESRTGNICPQLLEEKLKQAELENRLPKVVVPVHLCGLSCDMEAISKLSKKYGFYVVEDASHAIGGTYQGKPIGNCEYSDITVFSFHPVKIITTGEGGACLTNDLKLSHKINLLRSHGVTRDPEYMSGESDGPWYYQQVELGYNYRMTDIQAALGSSQMGRLASYIERRNEVAETYNEKLKNLPLETPLIDKISYVSARHLYVVQVEVGVRNKVFTGLREANIGVNVHYIPVHTQPFYKKMKFNNGPFKNAESYYSRIISLPMYPTISNQEISYVCESLESLL